MLKVVMGFKAEKGFEDKIAVWARKMPRAEVVHGFLVMLKFLKNIYAILKGNEHKVLKFCIVFSSIESYSSHVNVTTMKLCIQVCIFNVYSIT